MPEPSGGPPSVAVPSLTAPHRRRGLVGGAAIVGLGIAMVALFLCRPAVAQSAPHRAAVVVDLSDGTVKTACVEFTSDSIDGITLLRSAQMNPVVRGYSGMGGAVCALCGFGCPADSSCLTCKQPDSWQYFRAPSGTTAFTEAGTGASSTQVHDGDVDGWRWGHDGVPPGWQSAGAVCSRGPVYEATSQPATTTTAGTATTGPPDAPTTTSSLTTGSSRTPAPSTAAPKPGGATTTTASLTGSSPAGGDVATPTTSTSTSTTIAPGAQSAAPPRAREKSRTSPIASLVAFAIAVVALGGLWWRVRRRRAAA